MSKAREASTARAETIIEVVPRSIVGFYKILTTVCLVVASVRSHEARHICRELWTGGQLYHLLAYDRSKNALGIYQASVSPHPLLLAPGRRSQVHLVENPECKARQGGTGWSIESDNFAGQKTDCKNGLRIADCGISFWSLSAQLACPALERGCTAGCHLHVGATNKGQRRADKGSVKPIDQDGSGHNQCDHLSQHRQAYRPLSALCMGNAIGNEQLRWLEILIRHGTSHRTVRSLAPVCAAQPGKAGRRDTINGWDSRTARLQGLDVKGKLGLWSMDGSPPPIRSASNVAFSFLGLVWMDPLTDVDCFVQPAARRSGQQSLTMVRPRAGSCLPAFRPPCLLAWWLLARPFVNLDMEYVRYVGYVCMYSTYTTHRPTCSI
jgi:hypothetical protein